MRVKSVGNRSPVRADRGPVPRHTADCCGVERLVCCSHWYTATGCRRWPAPKRLTVIYSPRFGASITVRPSGPWIMLMRRAMDWATRWNGRVVPPFVRLAWVVFRLDVFLYCRWVDGCESVLWSPHDAFHLVPSIWAPNWWNATSAPSLSEWNEVQRNRRPSPLNSAKTLPHAITTKKPA